MQEDQVVESNWSKKIIKTLQLKKQKAKTINDPMTCKKL